jgi:uncharacterized membrane protein YdjX (TVP38/TMEM64 family)
MSAIAEQVKPRKARRLAAIVKLVLLAVVVTGVLLLYRHLTHEHDLSTPNQIARALAEGLRAAGPWAPILFILLYAIWVTLFLPAIVVSIAGSLLFPLFPATLTIILGATLGASLSFYVARLAGGDFVTGLLRGRLAAWEEGLSRNGFLFIFYLRLLYAPFTYVNFAAGLTRIGFRDFFWGTLLGIIPGSFIFVLFVGRVKELIAVAAKAPGALSGLADAGRLLFTDVHYLGPLLLFISSFFIPTVLKRAQAYFLPGKGTPEGS